ncbi:hypothetical protein [Magnetovibrio sp.]|uniref:hypothetical protein n=1 Tax=Magnetovibrio sp. TaxID=2024836 RepID=UPI002F925F65
MAVISGIYLLVTLYYNLDVFEEFGRAFSAFLHVVEPYEGDEVIPVLVLLGFGYVGDLLRQRRQVRYEQEISAQRLAATQVMMGSVQDVVNNFLNNMQLFRFEAERTGALGGADLQHFDDLIAQTARKLKEIEAKQS